MKAGGDAKGYSRLIAILEPLLRNSEEYLYRDTFPCGQSSVISCHSWEQTWCNSAAIIPALRLGAYTWWAFEPEPVSVRLRACLIPYQLLMCWGISKFPNATRNRFWLMVYKPVLSILKSTLSPQYTSPFSSVYCPYPGNSSTSVQVRKVHGPPWRALSFQKQA
ncbi:hypothetical protein P168DRAFT_56052 [Aspergillus campestris IBT 28561]|uniref:Uncharacterized protein n=1 Tax=Aspergillus campestris (strain IBT 28561) TaxID=1392248 RepID=A0A2I1CVX4_ASPC2|nr:uncharacterized protein P168DRAFT_56052 [Aspergillus campestris IBT 28561]PKY01779.1 hypothetical protein P168DRAFT_56052 [Aspergillus campestris IBT 28561]